MLTLKESPLQNSSFAFFIINLRIIKKKHLKKKKNPLLQHFFKNYHSHIRQIRIQI